jgi:lipoprotein LpqH
MNTMTNTRSLRRGAIGVAGVAALALALTACGGSSQSAPSPAAAPSAASSSAAAPGPAASAVAVDGKTITGHFETTCAKTGGQLALAIADTANATYGRLAVSATVTGSGTVQAVGIAGTRGGSNGLPYAIGYGNGLPGGSASVAVSGSTYHVTGQGVGTPDPTAPLAGPKTSAFDITFACSTVVGS